MNKVTDLRSALELLKTIPGQYAETDVAADPHAEISGIYPVSYTHLYCISNIIVYGEVQTGGFKIYVL